MSGIRIIGGQARGRRLAVPRGAGVRPTTGRVREALFAMLGDRVIGARVLDLCAGSGALGLEALSRGAAEVVFVERDHSCQRAIARNLAATGFAERSKVMRRPWARALRELTTEGLRFDVVLFDPPYEDEAASAIVAALAPGELLAPGGVIAGETRRGAAVPDASGLLRLARRRTYGDTELVLWLATSMEVHE
jgi:16S rRNA (guanine(966)-N(2))-methyltransferase RsmD